MRIYSQADLITALSYERLTRDLPKLLAAKTEAPQRSVHTIVQDAEPDASLLLMPAWSGGLAGVKIVNVTPGNAARGLSAVTASYLLIDAKTGEHLALLDGGELTARRTAAVAAIAAQRLAGSDARTLLLIGSGRIARELAFAYRATQPKLEDIWVHSQTTANAERLVDDLKSHGIKAMVSGNVAVHAPYAHLIACATLSQEPLIHRRDLLGGQHVALIGGYLPGMREADDDLMAQAEVWIDTPAALNEAGDLTQPIAKGLLSAASIKGTLADLCAGAKGERDRTTVFKSVGDASQDLGAATLAVQT